MNQVKAIRELLGVTQAALGDGIGCTQANVGHYEKGQTMPPDAAKKLIDFAAGKGVRLSLDHVYGLVSLPVRKTRKSKTTATA